MLYEVITIPHREAMDQLIAVATEKIYIAPEVIEIETAGFQVISELLERFIPIIDDVAEHGADARITSYNVCYTKLLRIH